MCIYRAYTGIPAIDNDWALQALSDQIFEPIVGHRCLAALQDALGEGEPEGLAEGLLDDVLAVVVTDPHVVERLKEVEVTEREPGDAPPHAGGELREVIELASSVCERRVLHTFCVSFFISNSYSLVF